MSLFERFPHFKAFTRDARGMILGWKEIPVWHPMTNQWLALDSPEQPNQIELDPSWAKGDPIQTTLEVRPGLEEEHRLVAQKWTQRLQAKGIGQQVLKDGDGVIHTGGFRPFG